MIIDVISWRMCWNAWIINSKSVSLLLSLAEYLGNIKKGIILQKIHYKISNIRIKKDKTL